MRYKRILMDIDDTIFDFQPGNRNAVNQLMAELGLTVNLLIPNLNWTNEIVPIKQSMSVMVTLFGGWLLVIALGGLYYLLRHALSPVLYLLCVAAALLLACVGLLAWLKRKGSRIFERL